MPERMTVAIGSGSVTALIYPAPEQSRIGVTLVLGHGAGAPQTSEFMVSFATGLARRGSDTMTFNFPYAERGARMPDRAAALEACARAAIETARGRGELAGNRLVIGGKSLGGRIASQVAAAGVEGLSGLVFLGYPLHPPGKPDRPRAAHLSRIRAPMLFVQGARDAFGTPEELAPIVTSLGPAARVYVVEGADHSLAVSKQWPVSPAQVFERAQDEITRWLRDEARGASGATRESD